ncbi:MAG: bifunctional UDP-N-acetylglucosamine diphosphorylase/glucosamine-1-phosphate N-acetyltransferase GlmU [Fimbriimonadaceae bacterium]|nr:bifunctional UDP-N-acetylglucosamine diphosphorylase/glucosamine-1-phosphate N-acetyltransferase GlmU [Fimbriimonadaceae bacterium]QYK55268.1 MAG: bifunctional UDP-N-acetylglucosamine diphosphorylase/glucosamine-1-phosphate N-acetyltransferase GlmU [Fimbriimonadaceae bacterium]
MAKAETREQTTHGIVSLPTMPRTMLAGLILAAGKGTRMRGERAKVLHEVAGASMIELVSQAVRQAGVEKPIVVVGHDAETVVATLQDGTHQFVEQREQLGTGHAAMMAVDLLKGHDGPVLVTPGDTPLLSGETLAELVKTFTDEGAQAAVASFVTFEPGSYGRVVRDEEGHVSGIVEAKDATAEELEIKEVNAAVYCFDCATLLRHLPNLQKGNAQGEYYLTDVIAAIRGEGGKVVATCFDDPDEFMGVNDRWQLAEASRIMRLRVLRRHALNGVTIVDPSSTYIGAGVQIGPDTLVHPMTVIDGDTRIGSGCTIGPNAWVKDSAIGDGCQVFMSHVDQAEMADGARCGPFSNLRPGTRLGARVKIGNFVEIKNGQIGEDAAVSHLTYIGDASVGARTNVGAGTITCNYDGFAKHRTEIGADTFIGSNSTIVAPRTIGDGAMVAAGSVVTEDVPDDAMAVGRARQVTKEQWVASWRQRRQTETLKKNETSAD